MPSPASSTVPVSMTATFWSKPSISLRMIWLISSARICIGSSAFSLRFGFGSVRRRCCLIQELFAQAGELRADAAVQHQIDDARDQAADQARVDLGLDQDLLLRPL